MKLFLSLLLVWLAWSQTGSLQVQPVTRALSSSSNYTLTYYTFYNLPSGATFLLDFSSTYITVPSATINSSATIQSTPSASSTANCSSSKCTLMLNQAVTAYSSVVFTFGALTNPYFLMNQTIMVTVTFNASYKENLNSTISGTQYTPLTVVLNNMVQSNYGVGNTEVTYTFNLTLPMTPKDPQLAVTLPSQVGIGNLQTTLSFYNSIQNANPILFGSIVLFPITTPASSSPGTILLTLSGLINPQAIGSSSSFTILLQLSSLPNSGGSCSSCKVALIDSGLIARSTVAGNIMTLNLNSSNSSVSQKNNLKVYSQLFAPIPQGGKYRINLPVSVQPVQPINCLSVYGFSLTSSSPSCSYNSTSNSVSTDNFYVSGINSVVFGLDVINPPDTRTVDFTFQTFDAAGNMIGNSSAASHFTAVPLLLNAVVAKNATEVATPFKLTVNVTLAVALTSQDFIQVVLPPAGYSTSNIVCSSGGITIPCTSNINPTTDELTVSLAPPCSQCSAGATLSFAIDKLTNPSFISSSTQGITVQTAHSQGVVEQLVTSIALSASVLSVTGYSRSGPTSVGAPYQLSFSFSIPSYLSTNGGQLILQFPQDDSYVPPVNSNGYTFLSSLHIEDSQGNDYVNSVVYYTNQTLQSVMKVVVQICGSNPCTGTFTAQGLSRGYYPLTSMAQQVTLTTTAGETVSTISFSTLAFNPLKAANPLLLSLTNSVTTLSSNYQLTLVSNKVPIQGSISFPLSAMHTINGGCFAVDNSSLYNGVLVCGVLNNTVTINFSGDMTPMMAEAISFQITIINVTNPSTVQPLTYSITTQYNNQNSQTFSTTYSIENPLPLSLSYSRTNSTYGQPAVLTLTLTSDYSSLKYSEIKLTVPTNLMSIVANNNYKTALDNGTFLVDGIYSMSNGSVTVSIVNPSSTAVQGEVTFGMYLAGYLSATGTVAIATVGPVFLGLSASSSNRIVGNTTQLLVSVNRVNPYSAETNMVLDISPTIFDLSQAQYNGAALVLPLTLPIATSSFLITNLKNLLSVPSTPPQNGLSLYTVDASSNKVAKSSFNSSGLAPSTPTTGLSYAFTRSSTSIGGSGSLTVAYTPRFPTAASSMTIVLPANQMAMNTAACNIQKSSGLVPCQVIFSNSTVITLSYSGQTQTILTDVANIQPNSNLLSVLVANSYGEPVQKTSSSVSPAIELNQLSLAGSVSQLTVVSQNTVSLSVTSLSTIDATSKIVMQVPTGVFLSISGLNSQKCLYSIGGVNFTACSFAVDSQGWVQQVNLTNLGSSPVASNTPIKVELTLTNSWSVEPFSLKLIDVFVCSQEDSYLSKGSISVTTLTQAQNFAATALTNVTSSQTSKVADTQNSLAVSYVLPVSASPNTLVTLSIPKSTYTLNLSALTTNIAPSSSLQTSGQYILVFPSPCALSGLVCSSANTKFTFTVGVKNNKYVPLAHEAVTLQVGLGSYSISQTAQASFELYAPLAMGLPTITRTNSQANEASTVAITFTTPSLTSFSLVIAPIVTPTATISILNAVSFVGAQANSPLQYAINTTGYLKIAMAGSSSVSTSRVVISGNNSFLVPVNTEKYTVTIVDQDFIYFQTAVTPDIPLTPISSGVNLQRIVATVALSTQVYLNGDFPASIPPMTVGFMGQNYQIVSQNFNVSLGNVTNSQDVSDSSTVQLTVSNADVIAFKGTLGYTPALVPQELTALASLAAPATLKVLQSVNVTLSLTNYSVSSVGVTLPAFFSTLSKCCLDSTCSQTSIASCSLSTANGQNTINLYLKSAQLVSQVFFTVTAIDYQASFAGNAVISTGLPSAERSTAISVAVTASALVSTLQLSSWMVNANNTYTLFIQPVARTGYVGITLPEFIQNQITSLSASYSVNINGSPSSVSFANASAYSFSVPVSSSTTNITLTLSSVQNPQDSQPFSWNIAQSKDIGFHQVYASKQYQIAMKQFDYIIVSSVVRNATKVGLPVTITSNITAPAYEGQMVINFPPSQLYTLSACSVTVQGQNKTCQVLNASSILTTNVAGNAVYTITGLNNQKAYSSDSVEDPVQVNIGYPYVRASTINTSTTSVSPSLTLGAITLQSVVSTSSIALFPTTANYKFTIENVGSINGFILSYSPFTYYIPTNVACKINTVSSQCYALTADSLFVAAPASIATQIELEIGGMINYIKPGNWSVVSVQKSANGGSGYSDVDVYYSSSSAVTSLQPNSMNLRLIFPNNYAQSTPVDLIVLIDNQFEGVPMDLLKINLTIPQGSCQLLNNSFQQSFTLSCTFSTALTAGMTLSLYHPSYPTVVLAGASKSINILPSPTNNCNNQMCDSCSIYNGQEYCFVCREGLYSSAGECTSGCPQGEFPFNNSGVCQQCSPTCSSCYGYTSSQCLSCTDLGLVLSSGTCQQKCPSSSFAYESKCVQNAQCSSVEGCRVCSGDGFCYQCLPDYSHEPNCQYQSSLPPTLMIYILAPIAVLTLLSIVAAAAKCGGADSVLSQTIFSFSFLELLAWVLTVPIMPNVMSSMVLLSFLALRMIISIVSYEVFYRHNLGELSQKLLEEESIKGSQKSQKKEEGEGASDLDNWKTKTVRFLAHFNGPDSYQLLKSRIAEPVLSVNHHFAVHVLFMINRWLVGILMVYLFTVATLGDSIFMPAVNLACGAIVTLGRLMTWDKCRSCLNRIRP